MLAKVLGYILDFIPINKIKIILVSMLVLAGVFSSYKITSWYYSGEIEKLSSTVEQYKTAYFTLVESTKKQNDSILRLSKDQEQKQKDVKAAQEKAKQLSQTNNKQAQDILRLQLGNTESCQAASTLVDEELAKERK